MTSWDKATRAIGRVQPATLNIAREVFDAAKAAGHDIHTIWGMGSSSEHSTGRALDFMVSNQAAGDFIRNYVWKHRKRLRLRHVIWWQRITSTVTSPGVVRKMKDRGNSTANHMDHPHIFVMSGAYQAPSGSQKPPTSTKPPAKEEWRGKRVVAKTDVRFYKNPGWHPNNRTHGILKPNQGFKGGIHRKIRVGNGWQYEVSNSNGHRFYITASSKFVDLRPK